MKILDMLPDERVIDYDEGRAIKAWLKVMMIYTFFGGYHFYSILSNNYSFLFDYEECEDEKVILSQFFKDNWRTNQYSHWISSRV